MHQLGWVRRSAKRRGKKKNFVLFFSFLMKIFDAGKFVWKNHPSGMGECGRWTRTISYQQRWESNNNNSNNKLTQNFTRTQSSHSKQPEIQLNRPLSLSTGNSTTMLLRTPQPDNISYCHSIWKANSPLRNEVGSVLWAICHSHNISVHSGISALKHIFIAAFARISCGVVNDG